MVGDLKLGKTVPPQRHKHFLRSTFDDFSSFPHACGLAIETSHQHNGLFFVVIFVHARIWFDRSPRATLNESLLVEAEGMNMADPIIGMDPYLESQGYWPDFHHRFVDDWCDAIADRLPDNYEARLDERLNLVETLPQQRRRLGPDLTIEQREIPASTSPAAVSVATMQPITVLILLEEEARETYIEILHRPERSLVAVLELLSPASKEQPGRNLYLAKRNGLLYQHVRLFELDLLLGGQRLPPDDMLPPGDFYAFLSHADRRPNCDVYWWRLNQRLPTLPIPLRAPDADIHIDLSAVFATTYQRGRYARSIDYSRPRPGM